MKATLPIGGASAPSTTAGSGRLMAARNGLTTDAAPEPTVMQMAFAAAGLETPRGRIDRIVRAAVEEHGGSLGLAALQISRELLKMDAATVWEFFAADRDVRLYSSVEAMLRQIRQERGLDAPTPAKVREGQLTAAAPPAMKATPSDQPAGSGQLGFASNGRLDRSAPGPARPTLSPTLRKIAADSLLETFKINNTPIGQCTAGEVRSWARSRGREYRFAWLVADGLQDDMVIGQSKTAADAAAAMAIAMREEN